MLPAKFQVSWPFGSGEEVKNRFSRLQPAWISDRNDLGFFLPTCTSHSEASYKVSSQLAQSHPDASYKVSSQLAQRCRLLKQIVDATRWTMHNGH